MLPEKGKSQLCFMVKHICASRKVKSDEAQSMVVFHDDASFLDLYISGFSLGKKFV